MGTGIPDILKHCAEYGLPEPKFELQDGFVAVIYRKTDAAIEKVELEEVGGQIDAPIGGAIEDALTGRQQQILTILKEDSLISYKALSKKLDINESAVIKHMNSLKRKGFIERIGGTRGITEETAVMGTPCITLCDNTERPETCTIGTWHKAGCTPAESPVGLSNVHARANFCVPPALR